MKIPKLKESDSLQIVRRRVKPFVQPYYKVGSIWTVVSVRDGFVYVYNDRFKKNMTKLSFGNFDVRYVSKEEIEESARQRTIADLNEKMMQTFSSDDHTVITFHPLVAQIIALDWASKTRWSAIQHALPMQKMSRIVLDIQKNFDNLQRRDYGCNEEYDKQKAIILKWRKDKYKWEDTKMFRTAQKVAEKAFPDHKYPDMLANAICCIIAIECYVLMCNDAGERIASKMPELNEYKPLEMIRTTLRECMMGYLPDKEFTIDSIRLGCEIDILYNQIKECKYIIV